ncbi:MAG: hypothetical protein QOH68_3416 [Nocardioidaceae bacterium]|nr:hypothetical protein [Nocardioidaceae bacterium]
MSRMADKPTQEDSGRSTSLTVARIRGMVSRAVWIVCLTLALILAAAAFSFALDANDKNDLVKLIRDLANAFDLGLFDLHNPVKKFNDPNSDVKTALFNYGIAAVVYLIVGRVLERIIRP